jgi:hypothetical protein
VNLSGKAAETANDILRAFENPNSLRAPIATIFIWRKDASPCRSWSWRNQLIAALHGHTDARGFRQWLEVGRCVKKGEKAFFILSPCMKKVEDKDTGEEKVALAGFRGTPVFGFSQTDGDALPEADPAVSHWLDSLPMREVADAWGLKVEAFNGRDGGHLGEYRHGKGICLGARNNLIWAHELIHAADHRNGKLTELGQHWRSETVAQLGGAVLLTVLGLEHDADLGRCWDYIKHYADKERIDTFKACNLVLERTCEAVALVLDTAEALVSEMEVAA